MGKVRRGGFVFLTWKGDHSPRHVHVYRGGRFVVKWDLENGRTMTGKPSAQIIKIIADLLREGRL